MKKCRIKLFLKYIPIPYMGDVYFVYFLYTYTFSVVLELILSLFWITHRQEALYSCLSWDQQATESRLAGTALSVGVIWPHRMCSCACWLVSAREDSCVSCLCICEHGVSSFTAVRNSHSLCGLWLIATIGWEHGTAQAVDGHLVWSRRNQEKPGQFSSAAQ